MQTGIGKITEILKVKQGFTSNSEYWVIEKMWSTFLEITNVLHSGWRSTACIGCGDFMYVPLM